MEHSPPVPPNTPTPPARPSGEPGVNLAEAPELHTTSLVIDTTGGPKILVTEDRLMLVLGRHAGRLGGNWVAPLGILLTLGIALTTTDFKGTHLGVAGGTWETVFVIAGCVAFAWTAVALLGTFVFGGRDRRIRKCVDEIKKPKVG